MLYRTVWEPVFLVKTEFQKHVCVGKKGIWFPLMRVLQPFVTFYWHFHLNWAMGCWLSAWGDLMLCESRATGTTLPQGHNALSLCMTSRYIPFSDYLLALADWSSNPFSWPSAFRPAALTERGKRLSCHIVGKSNNFFLSGEAKLLTHFLDYHFHWKLNFFNSGVFLQDIKILHTLSCDRAETSIELFVLLVIIHYRGENIMLLCFLTFSALVSV